jgi:hypothetical protein
LVLAQRNLANLYDQNEQVRDYEQAVTWCRKAAEQGDSLSEYLMGTFYEAGTGVPQDYGTAAAWYRKAEARGCTQAMFALGEMSAYGRGVPRDMYQAIAWHRKAAQKKYGPSLYAGGKLYEMNGNMDKALTWYMIGVELAEKGAMNALADCYARGKGVERDVAKAIDLYTVAAALRHEGALKSLVGHAKGGDAHAQFCLATLCAVGGPGSIKGDIREALLWYMRAAGQGHAPAQTALELARTNGLASDADFEAARNRMKDEDRAKRESKGGKEKKGVDGNKPKTSDPH